MRLYLSAMAVFGLSFLATTASAACDGSNGRGWGSGKGDGQFTMTQADKSCQISFPGFMLDSGRVPATDMTLTRAPKSGKITLTANGPVYTPNAGFKGKDKFCTRNKAKGQSGQLSGCVTVTVN